MNIRLLAGAATRGARLATIAAIAVGSLAVSGTAAAETATFRDARGDMAGHGADIYRVKVVNDEAVRVQVTHDDLVRSYRSGAGVKMYLDTDRDRRGPEFVFLGGIYEGADYALQKAEGWKAVGAEPLRRKYVMRLDYEEDVTRIRFSRRALDFPEAVRVSVRTGGELGGRQVSDWLHGKRDFTRWVARG